MSLSASQLLLTKLKPPMSLANAIDRPRLVSQIGASGLPKVILVTAGAGFGKTTLLAQWHATVSAGAGWLSLDRNDQEPIGFLRYIAAALNQAGPIISAATESFIEGRATDDLEGITTRLLNDLVRLTETRVLFLDDYYLAETSVVDKLLNLLIERSPATFHLVIASRTLPPLPIATLKAHDALREIRASDLKFNQAETETFIQDSRKLDLGPSEMRVLNERTEGWVAGLQLASLYLKDSKDLQRSIESLSGNIRDITDYLANDVIRRLDADVQEFLLQTAVLERMNASLCNALLNCSDGQAKLEKIEASGLFLFPLDATREWYRYHHLFRDFLLTQLNRRDPVLVKELYRKASAWFSAKGLAEEAVDMALESGDFDHAAALVESSAMKMIYNGYMPQLSRWIRRLPEQVINQQLRFPVYQCWALMHMGKCHQAEDLLTRAESAIAQICRARGSDSESERERLEAELYALRLVAAIMADDLDRAYRMSLTPLPDREDCAFFNGCRTNTLALCAIARSDFALAQMAAAEGQRFHARARSSYGVVYGHCISGLGYLAQGRLSAAMRECYVAETIACREVGPKSFSAAMARVLKAVVLYEQNVLDEAYVLLEEYVPLVEECAHIEIRTAAFLALAGILGARGQVGAALRWLDQAISVSAECIIDRTRALVNHEAVRLRLAAGDIAAARRFARHVGIDSSIESPSEWTRPSVFRAIAQCRLLIAEGNAERAVPSLLSLADLACKTDRGHRHVQILTLLAIAYWKLGDGKRMRDCVTQFLRQGALEGYIRSIIDQGPDAGRMLHEFAKHRENTASLAPDVVAYLDDLCRAASREGGGGEATAPGRSPKDNEAAIVPPRIVEVLTEQENNVLQLLARGASNGQIAESLAISVNTVRWHVANVLSKLQVENRTQAASAAHSLGLVARHSPAAAAGTRG